MLTRSRKIILGVLSIIWLGVVVYGCNIQERTPATTTFTEVNKGRSSTLIIFVHGLCGNSRDTYKAEGGTSWPELMAKDTGLSPEGNIALASHSIAILGYDPPNQSITIPALVDKLRVEMESHKLSRIYDNIIIIAHSLGGVATIDMLPNLKEQDSGLHSKLRAVFLIATPAQGSPLASSLGALASFLAFNIKCWSSVIDLRTVGLNAYLDSINRRWNSYMKQRSVHPRVYCAYEGKAVGDFAVPVPREHIPAHCDEPVWGFDGDHLRIVKPTGRSDDMYVWVRRHVNKALGEAATFNKTQAIDDIIALHTAGPQVDDYVEHNIAIAAHSAKARLGCRYTATLKPPIRLAVERRVENFVQDSAKTFKNMLDKEFSVSEIREIIEFERMQFTVRRGIAAMPTTVKWRIGAATDEDVEEYFEARSSGARRKYEKAKRIAVLARIDEAYREASRVARTIPSDLLGRSAETAATNISAAKRLFTANLAQAFNEDELDRVLTFLATPVGKKYVDLAIRWVRQLDYRKTAQPAITEKQNLLDPRNYLCGMKYY